MIIDEFKKFAVKGNVLDMAVGIIVGSAFTKIINSLVSDIIMPPFGLILGKVDFSSLFISLSGKHYDSLAAAKAAGAPTFNYGLFLNNVIDFMIVAFAVFLLIKQVNKLSGPPALKTKPCPYCRSEISTEAVKCPQCTSDLKEAAEARA